MLDRPEPVRALEEADRGDSAPGGSPATCSATVAALAPGRCASSTARRRPRAPTRLDPVAAELAPRVPRPANHRISGWLASPRSTKPPRPRPPQELAAAHVATGSRMTNMKWTLAHSPVGAGRAAAVVSAARRGRAGARRAAHVAVLPRDLDRERLPDLLDVLPAAADRRGRGPGDAAARRVRRADRRLRPPPGRRPALGRRRAARAAGRAARHRRRS